ncbi:FtsX-like permease family protein [Candidatus Babela massiliensis]|uniref:Lipoprotein-releasing system periplasmic-binding and permease domains n=1 Tax=Candidatus Babela massiliensis TaxID=673862 RepID=V6DGV2_9BACT|nr:FtsX-like permease family protein [Candidatus Babela massiliensis]CDK30158.1 Lipoprotein-releasing system periplasmic-binding and permease domains [Candidatus Babela massiliensis]
MSFELSLALKYLGNLKEERSISSMAKVCFLSILISVFALTLICAIMNGFEKATCKKLQGIHSDVIINTRSREINFDKLKPVLMNEFKKYIKAASPFSIGQIILKSNQKNKNIHTLGMIKGIDPKNEPLVSGLKDMMLCTYKDIKSWPKLLKYKHIFIGQTLSQQLLVNVGDTIDLLYPDQEIDNNNITLHSEPVKIMGIFKTGINEFDEHIIISSLDLFQDIFQHGATGVNIKLHKDFKDNKNVIDLLRNRLKLEVFSWKDLYPAIVSALALEKLAMVVILLLITLIATMNIISLLFMLITHKRKDIALLKAHGMKNSSIRLIFIFISFILTLSASIIGILAAWLISYIIDHHQLIKVPDAYYVNYLPALMNIKIALFILLGVIVISLLVTIVPIRRTKDIDIAQILKSEAF